MAMIRSAWLFFVGLALVFIGERILAGLPTGRIVCDAIGVAIVLSSTLARALAFQREKGAARRVEGLLLLGASGCVVALALYFYGALAVQPTEDRLGTIVTVLWILLLCCSLLPLVLAQATAVSGTDDVVEEVRVRDAAASGLTIALAAAFLLVLGYIVTERDVKVDVGYFRTALPGSATVHMVEGLDEPLKVMLFFPEVNDVKSEVESYFTELAHASGRVEIEEHDRLSVPKLAKDKNVFKDGTIVLARGKQSENITVDTNLAAARPTLRTFDTEVQKALMKVARSARVAYVTSGHGEMTDPLPNGAPSDPLSSGTLMREALGVLNYRVVDLGVKSGLASEVPDDATVVLMIGAKRPFLDAELDALDRYLARGGSLFAALDPTGETRLGKLEQRLGVHFDTTVLADDRQHVRQRNNSSDNRLLVTDQFSAHSSIRTLTRTRAGAGVVVPSSGSFSDLPLEDVPKEKRPRRAYVVRSLPTTFKDENGNAELDGAEKRQSENLVVSIEGGETPETTPGKDKAPPHPMHAVLLASSGMVSDLIVSNVVLNAAMTGDAVKWLGGEEQLAGETTSEKDIPIEHTRSSELAWFYGTMVGAPLLVLGAGLGLTARRRKRRSV